MAPWSQIAKPFSIHFALNCFKTVCGAGFVGYGVALATMLQNDGGDDGDSDDHDHDDADSIVKKTTEKKHSNNADARMLLIRKYVKVAATIGFGLFLSLPSLMSQIVWETMIPGITATDIAYGLGTENVLGIIPKWNTILKKPTLSSLVPYYSTREAVGGLIGGGGGENTSNVGAVGSDRSQ